MFITLFGYRQTKFGVKILIYLARTIRSTSNFLQTLSNFSSAFSWFLSSTTTNGIFAFLANEASVLSVPTITEILPLSVFLLDKISLRQCGSLVTNTTIFFVS